MGSFTGLKNRKWDDISGWLLKGIQTAYNRQREAVRAWELAQARQRNLVTQEDSDRDWNFIYVRLG